MPQLFYPGAAWAMGVETALLIYLFTPGNVTTIGGDNAKFVHAALGGLSYYAYNAFVIKAKLVV